MLVQSLQDRLNHVVDTCLQLRRTRDSLLGFQEKRHLKDSRLADYNRFAFSRRSCASFIP